MLSRFQRRLALTLRRRPLLPFLLAATLAVDGLLVLSELRDEVFIIAPAFAQVGLLGVWAGRLGRGWLNRCIVALLAASAVCVFLFVFAERPPLEELLTVLLAYGVGVAAISAVSRLIGRVLGRRGAATGRDPVQFSIRGILTITTVAAVAMSLIRFADFPGDDPLELFLACAALGLLPLLAYEIVRRCRRWYAAVGGVLLVSGACALLFLSVIRISSSDVTEWFVAVMLQGCFYLVWLLGVKSRLHTPGGDAVVPTPIDLRVASVADGSTETIPETKPTRPLDIEA